MAAYFISWTLGTQGFLANRAQRWEPIKPTLITLFIELIPIKLINILLTSSFYDAFKGGKKYSNICSKDSRDLYSSLPNFNKHMK